MCMGLSKLDFISHYLNFNIFNKSIRFSALFFHDCLSALLAKLCFVFQLLLLLPLLLLLSN